MTNTQIPSRVHPAVQLPKPLPGCRNVGPGQNQSSKRSEVIPGEHLRPSLCWLAPCCRPAPALSGAEWGNLAAQEPQAPSYTSLSAAIFKARGSEPAGVKLELCPKGPGSLAAFSLQGFWRSHHFSLLHRRIFPRPVAYFLGPSAK